MKIDIWTTAMRDEHGELYSYVAGSEGLLIKQVLDDLGAILPINDWAALQTLATEYGATLSEARRVEHSTTHYVIEWGNDNVDAFSDLGLACDFVSTEAQGRAEFLMDGAEVAAENGDFEQAWAQMKASERCEFLSKNLDWDRRAEAPLYARDRSGVLLPRTMIGLLDEAVNLGVIDAWSTCSQIDCGHEDDMNEV